MYKHTRETRKIAENIGNLQRVDNYWKDKETNIPSLELHYFYEMKINVFRHMIKSKLNN